MDFIKSSMAVVMDLTEIVAPEMTSILSPQRNSSDLVLQLTKISAFTNV